MVETLTQLILVALSYWIVVCMVASGIHLVLGHCPSGEASQRGLSSSWLALVIRHTGVPSLLATGAVPSNAALFLPCPRIDSVLSVLLFSFLEAVGRNVLGDL